MHKIDIPSPRAKADRQVELRGVVLTRRERVQPEAVAMIEDASMQMSSLDIVEMLDGGIKMALDAESRKAWDRLRRPIDTSKLTAEEETTLNELLEKAYVDPDDDPITLAEMTAVGRYMVEAETALPTSPPSASTNGSNGTEASSLDSSPSPEAASTT